MYFPPSQLSCRAKYCKKVQDVYYVLRNLYYEVIYQYQSFHPIANYEIFNLRSNRNDDAALGLSFT